MAKHARASSNVQPLESGRSVSVQIPLPLLGALAGAESAFFDLCVQVGLQVFEGLMEQDREVLCGPKGRHRSERAAVRSGSAPSEITLGGRRIGIRRLRARGPQGEIALPSFAFAADRDPLDRRTMEAIAAGVSTRQYPRVLDPLRTEVSERSTSKSAVSRRFVALSAQQMVAWLSVPLHDLDLRIVMVDGIAFRDHAILIALGIDSAGKKHVLGIREGTTENQGVAQALLRDLLERGLRPDQARLFVIDGAKGLRSAIAKTFGALALVQRCQVHKRRNVLDHLPEHLHASVARVLEEAWTASSAKLAQARLEKLASSLQDEHAGAAASIREGLEETLTLQGLGLDPESALYRTLRSTNPIENLNGSIATYCRNVKRWRGGSMILRWVCAAVEQASHRFRAVRGCRELLTLAKVLALRDPERPSAAGEVA
jgi:putative transposase